MNRLWIRVEPGVYLYLAALLLILPLPWLAAAVLAAGFHEGCHLVAICLLEGHVTGIRIGIGGAEIHCDLPGKGRELVAALAGPVGSLTLLLLARLYPKLGICGAVQGLFNLLPVYPLDGGRALRCIAALLCPKQGERMAEQAEGWILLGLMLLAAAGSLWLHWGSGPILLSFWLTRRVILRNNPCKWWRIRVQ